MEHVGPKKWLMGATAPNGDYLGTLAGPGQNPTYMFLPCFSTGALRQVPGTLPAPVEASNVHNIPTWPWR